MLDRTQKINYNEISFHSSHRCEQSLPNLRLVETVCKMYKLIRRICDVPKS